MQTEQQWMRLLRTSVARTSIRKTAKQIGYADITVRQVLKGTYPHNTQAIAECVKQKLKPAPKPRKVKPAQLKQLDPSLHKQFKRWAELLTAKTVADVVGIEQDRVWPLIRGTDKHGGADVITKLNTSLMAVPL